MNDNTASIFNTIMKLPLFKEYIDIRKIKINTSTDLIKVAYTFRDSIYETFRIIYMRDNKIVGYESITSRMPNLCNIFNFKTCKMNNDDLTKLCLIIINRMFKLGSNGFYLVRNHPIGSAKASKVDIEITKRLAESMNEFLGHLIVGNGTFSFVEVQDGKVKQYDDISIMNTTGLKSNVQCKDNPIIEQKLSCRNDLARLMYDMKHSSNYSLLICCTNNNYIRFIQEIPNCFMNSNLGQIAKYIKGHLILTNSCKSFIATTSKNVFYKGCELKHSKNLTDIIAYNTIDSKIRILAIDSNGNNENMYN